MGTPPRLGLNRVGVRSTNYLQYRRNCAKERPRDAPKYMVPWKVLRVLTMHQATFPEICNALLFRLILRMCVQNLKFVALPVSEIIGGTQKNWAVPGYAHAPFFPQNFKGLLFGWTLWIYLPNMKFVALSVPEIIGGTQTIWAVLYTPTLHFLPNV